MRDRKIVDEVRALYVRSEGDKPSRVDALHLPRHELVEPASTMLVKVIPLADGPRTGVAAFRLVIVETLDPMLIVSDPADAPLVVADRSECRGSRKTKPISRFSARQTAKLACGGYITAIV